MSGMLQTIRSGWLPLRTITAVDFSTTALGIADLNPYTDMTERFAAYMLKGDTSQYLSAAAAVDYGSGMVKLPLALGHGIEKDDVITIATSTNYNAQYTVMGVEPGYVIVTATYVAETFAATTTTCVVAKKQESIWAGGNTGWNGIELRFWSANNAGTATFAVFGRREKDTCVKLIAVISVTAGTQLKITGKYFIRAIAIDADYWSRAITPQTSEEATGGMCTIRLDTMGWDEFWISCTALSHTCGVEYACY